MTDNVLTIIKEEIIPYVSVVDLRGWGESTLDSRLFSLIDEFTELGIRTRIYTNLTTHDENYWYEMGAKKIDIAISVDAANPQVYENIRRGAKYSQFLSNLKSLTKSRKEHNINSETYFSMVVSDINISQIPLIAKLAYEYNIPLIRLNPITVGQVHGRYPSKIGISKDRYQEYLAAISEALEICRRKKIRLQLGANIFPTNDGGFDLCIHPWTYVGIRYDGSVIFCDHLMANDSAIMGNIKKIPFKEIWNSPEYQRLRKWHLRKNFVFLREQGIECDWCYKNRYADCEYLFHSKYKPLDLWR